MDFTTERQPRRAIAPVSRWSRVVWIGAFEFSAVVVELSPCLAVSMVSTIICIHCFASLRFSLG